jgi:hypothetical protein
MLINARQAIAAERHAVNPIIADILDELLSREREHTKRDLTESMRALEL